MVVLGAVLGAAPVLLDATVTLGANLAILAGSLEPAPYWLVLVDAALLGLLAPVGFFLVLCGILLALFALRPTMRRPFRMGLGGAGVSLSAGLLLGLLRLSWYLLPAEFETLAFLQNLSVALFVAGAAAGVGTFVAFCGIAAILRGAPMPSLPLRGVRVRSPPEKSIYEASPSGR